MPYSGLSGGGSITLSAPKPARIGGGGSLNIETPDAGGLDPGKFSIDLTNLGPSLVESAGSAVDFGSGLIGGVAGAVGSIGPDADEASIGQLIEDLGRIPGGVGDFRLPYLGDDPTKQQARLGETLELAATVSGAPLEAIETEAARNRARGGPAIDPRALLPGVGPALMAGDRIAGKDPQALPPDLQARLDAGESVDAIADELVNRGQGFSQDVGANLAGQIILDPLNLIAPGASKLFRGAKGAGAAVRATDDLAQLGLGKRAIGTAYNAATRGMTAAGASLVDKVIGPTTSGVLQALGTKPYRTLSSGLGKLDRNYGDAFDDAFARGAAQMPRAVIGHYLADEASGLVKRFGERAMTRLPGDIGATVERRLQTARAIGRDDLERRAQELLQRVAPTFDGIPAAELAAVTARKLAAITGASVDDTTALLGTVDRQTAQTVHLAHYGKAGDDLARAKASIARFDPRAKNIDANRVTLVNDTTLTTERAAAVLDGSTPIVEAVERFPVLANRFSGKAFEHEAVTAFVRRLMDQDALITTVKRPTTGAHPLPKALSAWRARYIDEGYDLGFAPEDGWKVITDEDGVPVYADPFVHFVSEADPIGVANPLGRFVDSLFRGTTQTTIVQESRQRLVDAVAKRGLPISPNQTRAIHKALLEEAADRGVTPRSLVADSNLIRKGDGTTERVGVIDAAFQRFLTPDEYRAVTDTVDPVYLILSAFQGNLRTVGLTQYLTGGAKRLPGIGPMGAHVAERIYPSVRFGLNAHFQLQELIESKFLNAMRGVTRRAIDPEVGKVYAELTALPEFRYLAESGYFLNIATGEAVKRYVGVNTPVGRAMSRFADVQGQKSTARVAQVLSEHGDEFRDAVQKVNPRAWQTMTDAYGTTDPRLIADRYLTERMAIGPAENIDEALAAFDASRTLGSTAADETVWQAFRSTFEQASRQAFQTHYFRPQRGWLERTLNHPYLGIYPVSYMYGKVLPEFARFLLKRPFGLNAPLVGMAGLVKVQQATVAALADDAEFRGYLEDHPDAMYLMLSLIPGDPTNLGAGAPAWLRHVSEDAAAGRDITVETVGRELQDTAGYAFGAVRGPLTIAEGAADLGAMAADIFDNLDRAAREYDGQFGTPALAGEPR